MKLCPSLWTAACAVTVLAVPAAAQSSPQAQIEPMLAEQMAAANAHDTDRFLKDYVHDSTLVMTFNGMILPGFDSVRTMQLKWWNHGKSDVHYSAAGAPMFTVLGPRAVVVTQPLRSERTDSTGAKKTGDFVATSVWHKRSDGWKVVAVHESTAR